MTLLQRFKAWLGQLFGGETREAMLERKKLTRRRRIYNQGINQPGFWKYGHKPRWAKKRRMEW